MSDERLAEIEETVNSPARLGVELLDECHRARAAEEILREQHILSGVAPEVIDAWLELP